MSGSKAGKLLQLILCFMFVPIGCATVKPIMDPRVTIIDHSLSGDLSIINVSSVVNKGGLMEVQVTGINKTSFYRKPEYKIEWLDQNGFKISTILSRWTEFPAYKKSAFRFKAIAPKPTATDFRILIRKGI